MEILKLLNIEMRPYRDRNGIVWYIYAYIEVKEEWQYLIHKLLERRGWEKSLTDHHIYIKRFGAYETEHLPTYAEGRSEIIRQINEIEKEFAQRIKKAEAEAEKIAEQLVAKGWEANKIKLISLLLIDKV